MEKVLIKKALAACDTNPQLQIFNSIRVERFHDWDNPKDTNIISAEEHIYAYNALDLYTKKLIGYDKDGNIVDVSKSVIMPAEVEYVDVYDKDEQKIHNGKNGGFFGSNFVVKDMEQYKGCPNIMYIGFTKEGDISALKNCLNIQTVNSIGDVRNRRKSLKRITGNINVFFDKVNLTYLALNSTNVSGDISSLSNLVNLTHLALSSTNVSGDISSLSNLVNLTYLALSSTNVSGDISSIIDKLTKLNTLYINPTLQITDEQKKTLTDRGCTVYIF